MIEEATVDCYTDSERITGWFTVIEEHLAVPFETTILGVPITVERIEVDRIAQIVAVCRRGRDRQALVCSRDNRGKSERPNWDTPL